MDEDPSPELDIAAQMGFASFGAQPTSKKRKYNPATDAVVSASITELTRLGNGAGLPRKPPPTVDGGGHFGWDGAGNGRGGGGGNGRVYDGRGTRGAGGGDGGRGRGRGDGFTGGRARGSWTRNERGSTGSNNTPLGVRPPRRAGDGMGATVLPAEEEEGEDDMPGYVDGTPPDSPNPVHKSIQPTHSDMDGDSRVGDEPTSSRPKSASTSLPLHPPLHPTDDPPLRGHNQAANDSRAASDDNEGEDNSAVRPANNTLPIRPQGGGYDWAALRRGVRNARGDMCYYDASFVEDPWRGLVGRDGGGG